MLFHVRSLVCFAVVAALAVQAQAATIFSQDFETGLGGNESTFGGFTRTASGAVPIGGQFTMGHSGLNNFYSNEEYSYYQVDGINLAGYTNQAMTFDYSGFFEDHFDRFNVLVSTGAFAPPAGLLLPTVASDMQFIDLTDIHHPNLGQVAYDTSFETGSSGGVARFDLSPFSGQTINLRFQFGSDESITSQGFNMDNLSITGDVVEGTVPEPSSLILFGASGAAMAFASIRRRFAKKA